MNDGQTMNIYYSWLISAGNQWQMKLSENSLPYSKFELRQLDEFQRDELEHLKWLIDQQIQVLQNDSQRHPL
jgi:aminopeptidase C